MPVGSPVYFEGDIKKLKNKSYGIFFCEVEAPNNLNEPIIQKTYKIFLWYENYCTIR